MNEKRMFERFTSPVKVKYTILGNGTSAGESKDIGGGGIRLSLMERLEKGTALRLEFKVPGMAKPISVLGEVIWSREVIVAGNKETDYYETGINFLEDNPLKIGKILEYFRYKEEDQEGE